MQISDNNVIFRPNRDEDLPSEAMIYWLFMTGSFDLRDRCQKVLVEANGYVLIAVSIILQK
ncbi:hypothetical protein A3759_19035 [Thalassolituus sp. HI0120]|nr:hypothetical protein A3759_02750 [Thalassolituus sp. HI0120]KZZ46013.1 hypothetical protein A3759_19035 [Thalassolituus sp. HI0120]